MLKFVVIFLTEAREFLLGMDEISRDKLGAQHAQILKLENNTANVTLETILKVFGALRAKVNFDVELMNTIKSIRNTQSHMLNGWWMD